MKHIHIPTLGMHLGLLLLAAYSINDYPDFFLMVSAAVLITHLVWAVKSKRPMVLSHVIGCGVQLAVFYFGWIDVNSGAFGLGGGEFALLFYGLFLTVSFAVETIHGLLKYTQR